MIMMADLLMIIHFLWAAFMVIGLPLGLMLKSPTMRWIHFWGMALTAFFAAAGMYCPLTVWEETLRWKADPGFTYGESFLVRHLSPILYPQIEPWMIRTASVTWGVLTFVSMALKWPGIPSRRLMRKSSPGQE
jgi:hypothetical protein